MSGLTHDLTFLSSAYKPFKYAWAVDYAIQSEKAHWIEEEVELQDDVKQWRSGRLSAIEKHHITQILRLFTQSDVNVASNYCDQFLPIFRNHEIRQMLLSFAAREGTHQRAYALLNDTLGLPEEEYSAFLRDPDMKAKMQWMTTELPIWDSHEKTALYLAKAVCNEGMSLFSAFAMLLNYQRFGKMLGMCKVIEWSIKDETLHLQGMTRLFKEFCKEHPDLITDTFKADIYEMYREAVDLEDRIIDIAYQLGDIEGLSKEQMKSYIRYIADRRLTMLGLKPNWDIKENPLPWLDWILSTDTITNFFEQRSADYQVGSLTGEWGWGP